MKKIERTKNIVIYTMIVIAAALFDQLTKLWLYGKSVSLIGDFLWLESPALNTGAAFNLINNNVLLAILTSVFACVMIYLLVSKRFIKSGFIKVALAILLGGTVGNIIDRIAFGGVRDFIYFKSINFAIFNFADVLINVGVYLVVGYLLYTTFVAGKNKETGKEKKTSKADDSDKEILQEDEGVEQ